MPIVLPQWAKPKVSFQSEVKYPTNFVTDRERVVHASE